MIGEIVMLRAIGLGDFLVAVPAYRGIRRAYPGRRIVLAAPSAVADLAALTGAIDVLHPFDDLHGPLGRERPDVAFNLHGRGPQSHRLLDATGPRERIGYVSADTPPGWRGPQWREDEHESDRWCRLLWHLDIEAEPSDLLLARPPVAPLVEDATLIHPGAKFGCRRWPPARYAAVARELAAAGHRVLVTGSPGERTLVDEVVVRAGLGAGANLAGRTSPLELAALVAGARLLVCGDTGVAHLATAYGTPSVLLFGPVSPALWGPRTDGPHTTLWHADRVRGDRWAADPDPALLAITPDEVLEHCVPRVARSR